MYRGAGRRQSRPAECVDRLTGHIAGRPCPPHGTFYVASTPECCSECSSRKTGHSWHDTLLSPSRGLVGECWLRRGCRGRKQRWWRRWGVVETLYKVILWETHGHVYPCAGLYASLPHCWSNDFEPIVEQRKLPAPHCFQLGVVLVDVENEVVQVLASLEQLTSQVHILFCCLPLPVGRPRTVS